MIKLVGYHGTTRRKASKIVEEKKYRLSSKSDEWLGEGVYFFKDEFWACNWAKSESAKLDDEPKVLVSSIECAANEFFDLDSVDNKKKIEASMKMFANYKSCDGAPHFKNEKESRCFYCNFYAKIENILVYSCNFPGVGYDSLGFPKSQVQYCVRDNKIIKDTKILR